MDTIELQERFADVRERGERERNRRRRAVAAAAVLATAAVAAGAFGLVVVDGVPWRDAPPASFADREPAVLGEPSLVGIGTLPDAPVYTVKPVPHPFTFQAPPQGDIEGTWKYATGEPGPEGRDPVFSVGIDQRTRSGAAAGIDVLMPTETYAPERPWTEQDALIAAPTDADGWADWLERTGQVDVTDRENLEIGGLTATRFELSVADLPDSYVGCSPNRACVALLPLTNPIIGPARVGAGNQLGIGEDTAELTVIELGERDVLVTASGDSNQREQWLPLMRSVIDSLRFG